MLERPRSFLGTWMTVSVNIVKRLDLVESNVLQIQTVKQCAIVIAA
jgi:hypothetical protein